MRLLCVALLDGKVQRSEMILQLVESATRMLYRVWWHGGGYRHCLHCLYLYIGTARQRPPLCVHILQGNLALPDFVSFRLTWTATSTAAFGAYRATLASSPPRAPPLRSARYSATGVPRNLP
jgi:hypothetical protein